MGDGRREERVVTGMLRYVDTAIPSYAANYKLNNFPFSSQPEKEDDAESKGLKPGKLAECYNGAVLDQYTWSQNIREIDIKVPVPPDITKARDVGVEIKSSHLKVWLKTAPSDRGKSAVSPTCYSVALMKG